MDPILEVGILSEDIEEEGEGEGEDISEEGIEVDLLDFDTEVFKIPKGPFLPRSAPNLEGLTEEQVAQILQNLSDNDIEDLFNKNTESFRCLAQALISRSSLMRHILYHFPELEDPGIDEAFSFVEPEITFDDIGACNYTQLCKDMNIPPISRVIRSLNTDTLNLKYYGLSVKQFKAICSSVMLNAHIKTLIFEDNWITPAAALWLCEMLRENNSIKVLNLRECRLGPEGIKNCWDGFNLSQSVREIDLSFNDLGDEGIEIFVGALKDNHNVEKLNLGHNNLGELSGKLLGELLKEHTNIDYLDLSWNDLYMGKALADLLKGIAESDGLEYLNLSWNGIGTQETTAPVAKYIKSTEKLQHLDLSFNRLMGKGIAMLAAALKDNVSMTSINLGFNLITPADAIKLASILRPDQPLEYMDLQNVYVNKNFLPIWKKLTSIGKSVRIEGILEDYTVVGPDKKKVVFDRCRYLAQKPKKKKLKKDFGTDFIWNLPDDIVDNAALRKLVKKSKIKLDNDLIDMLGDIFSPKKKRIELKLMRESYLDMFPDTVKPPPPVAKKDKKKKKGRLSIPAEEEIKEMRPSVEDKAISTDSFQLNGSSLVTARVTGSRADALKRLSVMQEQLQREESAGPEELMSTVILDAATNTRTSVPRQSKLSRASRASSVKESVTVDPTILSGTQIKQGKVSELSETGELQKEDLVLKSKAKSIAFSESVQIVND